MNSIHCALRSSLFPAVLAVAVLVPAVGAAQADSGAPAAAAAPADGGAPKMAGGDAEGNALLKLIVDAVRPGADITRRVLIEERQAGQKVVREAILYENQGEGTESKLTMVFTAPKSEQGTGYLRLDRNLFSYDPRIGKWDRRTERERLAGTNMRRSDLSSLTEDQEYDAKLEGEELVGKVKTKKLTLTAKEGIDTEFPVAKLWVDAKSLMEVKREEYALSGKLLRTTTQLEPKKVMNPKTKKALFLPGKVLIKDEVEKDRVTHASFVAYEIKEVDPNVFSKGYVEKQSR